MKTLTSRRGAGYAIVAALVGVGLLASLVSRPLVARAATFQVELEKQIIHGAVGDRVDLGTFSVPESMIGLTCIVEALGNNNRSVHVGNNIEIASVNTVTLFGVEDSQFKDTIADGPLTLAEDVTFTLVLGPDPTYSAELTVTFDCTDDVETTTTTVPVETTVTTIPETTTTVPETTTTVPVETTVTTIPETTTTVPETTTTVEVSPTTTVQVAPTTTPSTTPSTLPFTGNESETVAYLALVALAAGATLIAMTRRSEETRV